jgi:cytochrome c2
MKPPFILLLAVCAIVLSGCTVFGVEIPTEFASTMNVSAQGADLSSQLGSATRGEEIFKHGKGDAPPCGTCHALAQTGYSIGPVMLNISQRASSRVAGLSADQYLRQSILDPNTFLVPGFRSIMYNQYATHLDEQDILDLIAYLKTL